MMSVVSEGFSLRKCWRLQTWSMVDGHLVLWDSACFCGTHNKKLSHSSQLLRPFTFSLKHEKQIKSSFLGFSLSFAFLPKVDGGSQFGKTVLFQQQNVNIVCIFSHRHPIIFCPLPHHPDNVLHLKDKCFPKYMNCKVVFRVGVEFQYWISEATLLSVKWAGVGIHKITKRTQKNRLLACNVSSLENFCHYPNYITH